MKRRLRPILSSRRRRRRPILPVLVPPFGGNNLIPTDFKNDIMKQIMKIMSLVVAITAFWIGLLKMSLVPDSYTWMLPVYLIVALGCYGLLMVGIGLMLFRTCPEEAILLQKDITEARVFLKEKGVDVGPD